MKTVEEYEREKRAQYEEQSRQERKKYMLGIACPKCGAELYDPSPSIVLTSCPPRRRTRCHNEACDYTGSVIR